MKRLWKRIPPCLSDTQGFEAVMNQTAGLGIIDDASHYKPRRLDGQRKGQHGPYEGSHGKGGARVVDSGLRNTDIIHGTQQKVLQAFKNGNQMLAPDFVLLAYAPSSSMIGSDLEESARIIETESGVPAACVNVYGDKDYLYGISRTLEAMGKLLLKELPTIPGTVNLLGCNEIDWCKDTLADVEAMIHGAGYRVLSRWGMKESTQNLKTAAAASLNWVVNVSGIRLARHMEQAFGIPYIIGAPFGKENCDALVRALKGTENAPGMVRNEEVPPKAVVIGEQLAANAIRSALLRRGLGNVRVLSFLEMDKSCMLPGDCKLSSEEDLQEQLKLPDIRLAIADPDYAMLAGQEVLWIPLPNVSGMSPVERTDKFNLAGEALEKWLETKLGNG